MKLLVHFVVIIFCAVLSKIYSTSALRRNLKKAALKTIFATVLFCFCGRLNKMSLYWDSNSDRNWKCGNHKKNRNCISFEIEGGKQNYLIVQASSILTTQCNNSCIYLPQIIAENKIGMELVLTRLLKLVNWYRAISLRVTSHYTIIDHYPASMIL